MDMHQNLERLAFIDKAAWESFKKVKVEKGPSPFRVVVAFKVISFSKSLSWWRFWNIYLVWLALSLPFGYFALYSKSLNIAVACGAISFIFFGFFFKTWGKYEKEYYLYNCGKVDPLVFAFGTDNASDFLKSFEKIFMEKIMAEVWRLQSQPIKTKDFDGLIKLNKAAQDKDEVNLGIGETIKKAFYGALLVALVTFKFEGFLSVFATYTTFVEKLKFAQFSLFGWFCILVVLLSSIFLIYDIFVGQTSTKRRKKKYLLLLNILKETWVDASEKIPAASAQRSIIGDSLRECVESEISKMRGLKKMAILAIIGWISGKA